MENKLAKIVAVLAVAGLMTAGSVVYAASGGDDQASGKGYQCPMGKGAGKDFMKELNLTPEQKEKLKVQREARQATHKVMREQLKAKTQELYAAIAKPGATRTEVNGLVNQVMEVKGQIFSQRTDDLFAMKEILTPEQFTKMQEMKKERMNKKHEGWGKKDPEPAQS